MNRPHLGMTGTGTWNEKERPQNWREGILFLFPNGPAPLTAMMAKTKKKRKVDDPTYHYFTKQYHAKAGDLESDGVYTDEISTALTSGTSSVSGDTLTAKVKREVADFIRVGHQVLLRNSDDHRYDVSAIVKAVNRDKDDNSFVVVTLLENDDKGPAGSTNGLHNADRILVVGSIHAEGATRPEAISFLPKDEFNHTQIFRTSLSMTRTALRTRLRTGDQYKEAKREALEMHSVEMEDAFLFGERTLTIGENGHPQRTTRGLVNWIRALAPSNINDYRYDSDFTGTTWKDGGADWFDERMRSIFRWGNSREKVCLAGDGAILGIQNMVRANSLYNITRGEASYGIKVMQLESAFGTLNIINHPRLSIEPSAQYSMIVLETDALGYSYIDDTNFMNDQHFMKGGGTGKDAKDEEFLTEAGLEVHHPELFAYWNGVGRDNTMA